MNKLVIIGNGFDLAHGLKTSYKDFLLWYLKKLFEERKNESNRSLASINVKRGFIEVDFNGGRSFEDINTIHDFKEYCDNRHLEIVSRFTFIKELINDDIKRWVDIETEYYTQIKQIYKKYETHGQYDKSKLIDINRCMDLIRIELIAYLQDLNSSNNSKSNEIKDIIYKEFRLPNKTDKVCFLNFNYTTTIENYSLSNNSIVIYIHGHIVNSPKNPVIFGYGDETDKHYEKIEDLNENEFTRHFKSFGYLTSDNYQILFDFLEEAEFDVFIMGHSCGISDRVLFTNIFNHDNFKNGKIKIYYYEYEKDGVVVNDFFQKTQELSRHFDMNSKHKMRTKVFSFNESKPLPQFKQ